MLRSEAFFLENRELIEAEEEEEKLQNVQGTVLNQVSPIMKQASSKHHE